MSVMGSGDSAAGYIAESLDPQGPRFDLKGGGATTAMNFFLDGVRRDGDGWGWLWR